MALHATLSKAPICLPTPIVSRGALTDEGATRLREELARFLNPATGLRALLVGDVQRAG